MNWKSGFWEDWKTWFYYNNIDIIKMCLFQNYRKGTLIYCFWNVEFICIINANGIFTENKNYTYIAVVNVYQVLAPMSHAIYVL